MRPPIAPLDASKDPRVCVPLRLLKKLKPENAGALFDRLFDAAERKFGPYPAFRMETEGHKFLCAREREEPTQPQRPVV